MGESSVKGDGGAVTLGDSQRARVGPAFEQWQGLGLYCQILAVQARHQPELTTRLLRFRGDPSQPFGSDAQVEGLGVSGEGPGCVSPDVAGELIQKQHQCQPRSCCVAPVPEVACQSLFDRRSKTAQNFVVKVLIPAEPLHRPGLFKPEAENRLRGNAQRLCSDLSAKASGSPAECCPGQSIVRDAVPQLLRCG